MSSRKKQRGPSIASYVGLVRFYEETEEQIKLSPYTILLISYLTAIIVLLLRVFVKPPI
uniref:Preprotein translocase subunit SecG n=1 Tax=Ignisphaera aggregans TaxID=334771 RepID=A0A7C2Z9U7_9CREN